MLKLSPKRVLLQTMKTEMKCRDISPGSAQLAKTKSIFRERDTIRVSIYFEIITCDSSIYTKGHPGLTVSNFMDRCSPKLNKI